MPLYEFRCPSGHDFEKFYRSIGSAQSEEKCPECGAMAHRVMSAAGLVFKGSGFYITDYGKDGKKAEREASKSTPAKSDTAKSSDTASAKPSETPSASESKPAPAEKKPSTPSTKSE
jgi:putative FmdB family regulatory protein